MSVLIVTGYHERSPEDAVRAAAWDRNTRLAVPKPEILVVKTSEEPHPVYGLGTPHVTVVGGTNLGHVGDLLKGEKTHAYCGWSASIVAGAAVAYTAGRDMCYKEADCFWKGDCIGAMHKACEGKAMVFGTNALMGVAQSLFYVRHEHLLRFVADYLSFGDDRNVSRLPELKFAAMEYKSPELYGRHGIPGDRDRPIDWSAEAFAYQQLTPQEMSGFQERGLA